MHHDVISQPLLARQYFEAAESHGERFVMESKEQARRFDPQDFDSILACSRLLTVFGFAFYRTHRANGVALSDSAAWTWLHLLRGVKTVYTAIQESGSDIEPIMAINMRPEIPGTPGSQGQLHGGMRWHREHQHFNLVNETERERFQGLFAGLLSRKADFNQEELKDLHSAIATLEEVTRHVCTGEVSSLFRAMCTWPGSISTGFVGMLLNNEPFALVIYAHWLMLVVLGDQMWWFGDMGLAGVQEVLDICLGDLRTEAMLRRPKEMIRSSNANTLSIERV